MCLNMIRVDEARLDLEKAWKEIWTWYFNAVRRIAREEDFIDDPTPITVEDLFTSKEEIPRAPLQRLD